MFGTSSERVTREIEQLELKLDELEAARAARDVAEAVSIASSSRPAPRPLIRASDAQSAHPPACRRVLPGVR
jgi:hypothetical protein